MTHLVALLFFSLSAAAPQPPATSTGGEMVARWASYARGERWVSILLRSDLERSPEWVESEETPPLSPRRAVEVARAQMAKVVPDAVAWPLHSIRLLPVGGPRRWVYIVSFSVPPPTTVGGLAGSPFEIVVLMNGEAVPPTRGLPER